MDYKEAGVNINKADSFIKDITCLIDTTYTSQVIKNDNGFAGLYKNKSKDSILVFSTDGVGTKLKIANYLNIHNTIDYFHRNNINAFHIGNVINADNEVFYY